MNRAQQSHAAVLRAASLIEVEFNLVARLLCEVNRLNHTDAGLSPSRVPHNCSAYSLG